MQEIKKTTSFGFNEAEAFTPRIQRTKFTRFCRRMRFNEAEAFTPRIRDCEISATTNRPVLQ